MKLLKKIIIFIIIFLIFFSINGIRYTHRGAVIKDYLEHDVEIITKTNDGNWVIVGFTLDSNAKYGLGCYNRRFNLFYTHGYSINDSIDRSKPYNIIGLGYEYYPKREHKVAHFVKINDAKIKYITINVEQNINNILIEKNQKYRNKHQFSEVKNGFALLYDYVHSPENQVKCYDQDGDFINYNEHN